MIGVAIVVIYSLFCAFQGVYLYLYSCANETFKILKFRSPIVVHNLYKFKKK